MGDELLMCPVLTVAASFLGTVLSEEECRGEKCAWWSVSLEACGFAPFSTQVELAEVPLPLMEGPSMLEEAGGPEPVHVVIDGCAKRSEVGAEEIAESAGAPPEADCSPNPIKGETEGEGEDGAEGEVVEGEGPAEGEAAEGDEGDGG